MALCGYLPHASTRRWSLILRVDVGRPALHRKSQSDHGTRSDDEDLWCKKRSLGNHIALLEPNPQRRVPAASELGFRGFRRKRPCDSSSVNRSLRRATTQRTAPPARRNMAYKANVSAPESSPTSCAPVPIKSTAIAITTGNRGSKFAQTEETRYAPKKARKTSSRGRPMLSIAHCNQT